MFQTVALITGIVKPLSDDSKELKDLFSLYICIDSVV